jgi:hypothetical protein
MATQNHHSDITEVATTTEEDAHTTRESLVPPVLTRLFERPVSEQTAPQPLAVFQPADWPSCPDCAERLIPAAVATDANESLVAAAMRCYNSDHETKRYVYNVVTETVYVDQVCAGPSPRSPDG